MTEWRNVIVDSTCTILNAMRVIDKAALQLAIVVDDEQKLIGLVTDGDIRRGILKGLVLSDRVDQVMNRNPTFVTQKTSLQTINKLLKQKNLRHIPVVDENKRVIDLKLVEGILNQKVYDNIVVLMAGGLGTRLHPLTEDTPKPLLKVGGKPILETIIEGFCEYGFRNFVISVNYRKELIKNYFGDGSQLGISISYLDENQRLGTAGALSLMKEKVEKPIIVMNGDLLTKVNFEHLLLFHKEHDSQATMCVREHEYQVPYGVIKTSHQKLISIEEKPIERYFVNAGIYVLNPDILQMIPRNSFYDMPELFEVLMKEKKEVVVFPIREYWMDIGRLQDYEQANLEFPSLFQ